MSATVTRVTTPPAWMYVNELRIVTMFMGAAMVVLGLGLLIFVADGPEQADTVDVLLGTGVFLLLFCALLFVPRLRSRGAMSFSLLVEHAMDDVEEAVRQAVEESGRKVRIELPDRRFTRPPRAVFVEGTAWRFSLRDAPYRERKEDGTRWTEIVQCCLDDEKDEVAREFRERIATRLATLSAHA